jgi:hypothetical protein
MKVFCCFTPAHQVLFERYFSPSLPPDFEVITHRVEAAGHGDFLSPEFLECIRRKIDLILRSLRENEGEVILWSDVDIIFLRGSAADLKNELIESGKDVLFQREGKNVPDVNTGFIVCRANSAVYQFFEQIRDGLLAHPEKNEQRVANELLQTGTTLSWGYLAWDYYARTHGWPPAKSIRIYHANYTMGKDGIGQKIKQFRELRLLQKYGFPALILLSLPKIPAKIRGIFRRRQSASS